VQESVKIVAQPWLAAEEQVYVLSIGDEPFAPNFAAQVGYVRLRRRIRIDSEPQAKPHARPLSAPAKPPYPAWRVASHRRTIVGRSCRCENTSHPVNIPEMRCTPEAGALLPFSVCLLPPSENGTLSVPAGAGV